MNILFVYPTFPRSFWSFAYALDIYGRKALLPPLGLLTVAAMLPGEWNKRLVDFGVEPVGNTPAQFSELLRTESARWTKLIRDLKITLDN